MKSPPIFLSHSPGFPGKGRAGGGRQYIREGFTLVEVLVAVTVMSIMLALMATALLTMSTTWQDAQKRVNNFTKARAMLDIMDHDIQFGLFRSDLPAFPNGNAMPVQFYTMRPGISTTQPVRSFSAVSYSIPAGSSVLQRSDLSFQWADGIAFGTATTFPTTLTPRDTAPGMIDFKVLFMQKDGTLSATYSTSTTNPTKAIGFTLAVVDDQTLVFLTAANKVTTLQTALESAYSATPTRDVKANWEDYLNGATMNWTSYPKSLGVGFKIFERYVILPNAT